MLRPFSVVKPFGDGETQRLPLGPLVRDHGAGNVFDRVTSVDPEQQVVRGASGDEYGYEALVVAIGARAAEDLPGGAHVPGR